MRQRVYMVYLAHICIPGTSSSRTEDERRMAKLSPCASVFWVLRPSLANRRGTHVCNWSIKGLLNSVGPKGHI